jgi:DNA-binding Lrp family transcriptional regulator
VLIQTEVGKPLEVVQEVRRVAGVVDADAVTGPYDVVARLEAADLDLLAKLVVEKIQGVEGVTRTLTCPVVRLI